MLQKLGSSRRGASSLRRSQSHVHICADTRQIHPRPCSTCRHLDPWEHERRGCEAVMLAVFGVVGWYQMLQARDSLVRKLLYKTLLHSNRFYTSSSSNSTITITSSQYSENLTLSFQDGLLQVPRSFCLGRTSSVSCSSSSRSRDRQLGTRRRVQWPDGLPEHRRSKCAFQHPGEGGSAISRAPRRQMQRCYGQLAPSTIRQHWRLHCTP